MSFGTSSSGISSQVGLQRIEYWHSATRTPQNAPNDAYSSLTPHSVCAKTPAPAAVSHQSRQIVGCAGAARLPPAAWRPPKTQTSKQKSYIWPALLCSTLGPESLQPWNSGTLRLHLHSPLATTAATTSTTTKATTTSNHCLVFTTNCLLLAA